MRTPLWLFPQPSQLHPCSNSGSLHSLNLSTPSAGNAHVPHLLLGASTWSSKPQAQGKISPLVKIDSTRSWECGTRSGLAQWPGEGVQRCDQWGKNHSWNGRGHQHIHIGPVQCCARERAHDGHTVQAYTV